MGSSFVWGGTYERRPRESGNSRRGIAGGPDRSCSPVKRLLLIPTLLLVALAVAPAASADDLDWEPCGDRFQCADLKVPLDSSRPWWRKIEIPVIKLPATDPKRRIGTAIGGAGGPGQSGVDLIRAVGTTLFAPLNDRFDLVAFDQRGIGTVDCGRTPDLDPGWAEPHDVDPVLLAHRAREAGRRCLEQTPAAAAVCDHRQRGPRHGPAARGRRREEADLHGRLLRHDARRDLLEPVPRPRAGDGARRADGRRRCGQPAARGHARAGGELRGHSRPLRHALRGEPCLRVRRRRPRGGVRRAAGAARPRAAACPGPSRRHDRRRPAARRHARAHVRAVAGPRPPRCWPNSSRAWSTSRSTSSASTCSASTPTRSGPSRPPTATTRAA